eukprot:jgi/Psemu1/9108/gm1.9108_g
MADTFKIFKFTHSVKISEDNGLVLTKLFLATILVKGNNKDTSVLKDNLVSQYTTEMLQKLKGTITPPSKKLKTTFVNKGELQQLSSHQLLVVTAEKSLPPYDNDSCSMFSNANIPDLIPHTAQFAYEDDLSTTSGLTTGCSYRAPIEDGSKSLHPPTFNTIPESCESSKSQWQSKLPEWITKLQDLNESDNGRPQNSRSTNPDEFRLSRLIEHLLAQNQGKGKPELDSQIIDQPHLQPQNKFLTIFLE